MKSFLIFVIAVILCETVSANDSTHIQLAGNRVLLINSYHPQFKWTDEFTRGVVASFEGILPDENLHIEYLDGRRMLGESQYSERLYDFFKLKYEDFKPTIILVSDDIALNFMYTYHGDFFKDIPVVFGGINVFEPDSLVGKPQFTGVLEGMEIKGNLDLITRVHPSTERIIMISDQTVLGKNMVSEANGIIKKWNNEKVNLEIWDDFTLEELKHDMSTAAKGTIFLMLAIHKDRENKYFSFEKDLQALSGASAVPIYGMWGALLIGNGIFGGEMNDPFEHGKEIAEIGIDILEGKDVGGIDVKPKTAYKPHFDYNQLVRFGVSLGRLPEGSKVHFRPEGFYTKYKKQVNIGLGIMFFLLVTTLILAFSYRREKKLNNSLKSMTAHLEKKSEDLRQFAYVTSHDLRSPVVNLEGLISLFNPQKALSQENERVMDKIKFTISRLKGIIDDLIGITSLKGGKTEELEKVVFKDAMNEALFNVVELKDDNDAVVIAEFEQAPSITYARSHIISILEKLLSNALKFSDPQRKVKIEVHTEKQGDGVCLVIKDNGLGIDLNKYKNRVFKLFERFHSHIEGKGMGLYIVKNQVENKNGNIELISQPGEGSTFRIYLKDLG